MTVQVSTLANGLTVASDQVAGTGSATVGVWVGTGARHESAAQNGLSHMLEHMAFKGTTRRSALDIALEVEAVGGQLNAYTSREQTCYYARLLSDDLNLGLDILSDILCNPTFDAEEIAREQHVIVQEIGQAEDTPDDIVFDHLQEACYEDQAIGRSILGTDKTVASFDEAALRTYMKDRYRAPNMVLAAAGCVDHAALVMLAEQMFGDLPAGQVAPTQSANYTSGGRLIGRALEQTHVTFAFDGIGYHDDRFYAAQVLATALGGGMSSRLFQEVREKRGLAYSVYAFSSSMLNAGQFGFYAGTGPDDVAELVDVMADECLRIVDDANDDETERAKAQLRASMVMAQESSSQRAEQLARQLLCFGRPVGLDEQLADLAKVDAAAMRQAAKDIFTSSAPAYAAIGPQQSLAPAGELAAKFS